MNRRIVLVRHARAAPSGETELLRPLTDEGTRQALLQGRALLPLGPWGPVLSSPATRCLQTAHGLLEGLGRSEAPRVAEGLVDSAPVTVVVAVADRAPDGAILVGHQPNLVDLACALTQRTALSFSVPPATAIVLRRDETGAAWTLHEVLPAP